MRAPRLHGQRDGAPPRRRRARRSVRRPGATSRTRVLRTVSPTSFARGPAAPRARAALRLAARPRPGRGDAAPDARGGAAASGSSPASASAAGSPPTGWASCRSCCSARSPAKALRLARDTGVLVAMLPEFEPAIGFDPESRPRPDASTSTSSRSCRRAADAGPLRVGSRALPRPRQADRRRRTHARPAARAWPATVARRRLRYPIALRAARRPDRALHTCSSSSDGATLSARALSARARRRARARPHRRTRTPTCAARTSRGACGGARAAARARSSRRATQPHRISDLAINGNDLIELGFAEGPALGEVLASSARARRRRPDAEHARPAARAGEGARVTVYRWDAPAPYEVVFSTRAGRRERRAVRVAQPRQHDGDDAEHVDENRRRAVRGGRRGRREARAQPPAALGDRQPRGRRRARRAGRRPLDRRAGAADAGAHGRLRADRARARRRREPALALAPRGLARAARRGSSTQASRALGGTRRAARRPGDRPLLLRGRPEVADPFRERFGADVASGRMLDLWTRSRARVARSGRHDGRALRRLHVRATRSSSSRTGATRAVTGRQGVVGVVAG